MNDPESLSQLLQVCARKTEDFVQLIDCKHMVWLMEIEEAAKKMFNSDFTAEPELMPKTPSQKRRRKKRTSILPDENRDPSRCRISRRKSSVTWSSSVRRLSSRHVTKQLNASIQEEDEQPPTRVTRAKAQASMCVPIAEKPLEELSLNKPNDCVPQVKISAEVLSSDPERKPALDTVVLTSTAPPILSAPPAVTADNPSAPVTPEKNGRTAGKLKIASSSTPKQQAVIGPIDLTLETHQPVAKELELSNHSVTPTGSKHDRRSVRRSIVGRKSTSCQPSLANQYSLASKRENMTKEAVRKSIRRSVSRKRGSGVSSSSSYKSYPSSIEEVTVKIGSETIEPIEEAPENGRSLQTRAANKIAITNQPISEPQRMVTRQSLTLNTETAPVVEDQIIRRVSYKRAVDDLSDDDRSSDEQVNSPPRKKTPSPPCPPSKVVKTLPHMKTFLHTVQKNQLLMMTPGSISKSFIAKSFIKRNTPLKVDPKEKERQRQETLRKKEEAELQRKQKMEEGKKRKQEELKLRREERQRKVLQARERVEQLEEEKKKKIEQKFAQIDEKVREDRVAEEKAKKKTTAKKQEEAESRRRQEEDARKLKAKAEEEERKKREEEEQERQRKLAEAKKMADLERERQIAAEKEQERLRAEKERERLEKNKALQLQKELEQAAQEREQRREAEERKRKEQERLEQERQERLRKEMEVKKAKELEAQKLREEQERIAKEKQAAVGVPVMNVTIDLPNPSPCESYEMTPKSYKLPSVKVNPEDYGMDLNSDDSTDDESKPRKPIPAWASGTQLSQAMRNQYYHPIDVDKYYGIIHSPKLEDLFYKSKPRYFKRTSSAVWHSPPISSNKHLTVGYGLKK